MVTSQQCHCHDWSILIIAETEVETMLELLLMIQGARWDREPRGIPLPRGAFPPRLPPRRRWRSTESNTGPSALCPVLS